MPLPPCSGPTGGPEGGRSSHEKSWYIQMKSNVSSSILSVPGKQRLESLFRPSCAGAGHFICSSRPSEEENEKDNPDLLGPKLKLNWALLGAISRAHLASWR